MRHDHRGLQVISPSLSLPKRPASKTAPIELGSRPSQHGLYFYIPSRSSLRYSPTTSVIEVSSTFASPDSAESASSCCSAPLQNSAAYGEPPLTEWAASPISSKLLCGRSSAQSSSPKLKAAHLPQRQ